MDCATGVWGSDHVTLATDGVGSVGQTVTKRPESLASGVVAIEDADDDEFIRRWANTGLWGTPLYWRDALTRWPSRHAAAVATIANARRGGVLVHCGRGHDRTGIMACLVLAVVGVEPEEIARDYEMSDANMPRPTERDARSAGSTEHHVAAGDSRSARDVRHRPLSSRRRSLRPRHPRCGGGSFPSARHAEAERMDERNGGCRNVPILIRHSGWVGLARYVRLSGRQVRA